MKRQQGGLLPMAKFREMVRLHELGHNQSAIAQSCGVARSTVQDYLRRATAKGLSSAQLSQMSDSQALERLGKGNRQVPIQTETIDFAQVAVELQRKGVTLALLWQEGLDKGAWQLSYGGFCRRYNRWRAKQKLSMRQVHKGGEKLFVDYCGLTVPVTPPDTGEVVQAQIFVACLGASNYTYAEATPTQELPHWLGSHGRAFAFLGGVPRAVVPDNLKSGVTDPCRYEPGLNRAYQELAQHYEVAVIPARPKKPKDKAKVEKAVQEVERQILAPLRHEHFTSFAELNGAIAVRLSVLNQRVMSSYGLSRQALFEQVDQPALRPLPVQAFVLGQWKRAKVNLDYHIEVEGHYYSVPYHLVHCPVEVKVSETLVEVFHEHQRMACHQRSRVRYRHTTLPAHMPPEHWAYKSQSKDGFLSWAERIGTQTKAQVQAIFESKAHEEQAFRSLKGLQRLAGQYGKDRLEAACHTANVLGMVGLKRLRSLLEHRLEQAPVCAQPPSTAPLEHANLRGAQYYH
ncbi:IS21 family transposase [Stenomitos frigidus]|uniref:Integrase n=2 Tax=Stenomitos TaxID=1844270 RepID=A0A2T1DUD5_9CYAN|nr:IS21 family transposase [Stenomitos frigidus]PSB24082.1 integrase [Stenomitos frigidus ULC18]